MKIRNAEDLARHMGAYDATEESLSRRLYKDTDCGASLMFTQVRVPSYRQARQERWQATARLGLTGVCIRVRRNGRGPWCSPGNVPKHVGDFLCMNEKGWISLDPMTGDFRDWNDFKETINGCSDCKVQKHRRSDGMYLIRFWVTLKGLDLPPRTRPGILISSIVEGVDWNAESQELAFPFSSKAFYAAVQAVEDSASEIWNDTHGCEGCAKLHGLDYDNPDTENGYVPVHPDCKGCGGNGQIQ